MLVKADLVEILNKFSLEMKYIFNEKLNNVMLFGSYASGSQDEDSDIDIMILVNLEREEIIKYRDKVVSIACDYGFEYDVLFSPIIQSLNEFEMYKNASGFFENIEKVGVKLIAWRK